MSSDSKMGTANGTAETSPLLGQAAVPDTSGSVNGTASSQDGVNQVQRGIKPSIDEESQTLDEGQAARYEGLPDVKAKMKYILPAIGIGVRQVGLYLNCNETDFSQIFLSAADQTITVACYGKIGSDLKALNSVSWISTA